MKRLYAALLASTLATPACAEFYPNGIRVEMEPADLWAIATLKVKQLPPLRYDRPVTDPVEVIEVANEATLRTVCGLTNLYPGAVVIGCAAPKGNSIQPDRCIVYLGPIPAWTGITRNINLRHELGHCNGWPKDHRD